MRQLIRLKCRADIKLHRYVGSLLEPIVFFLETLNTVFAMPRASMTSRTRPDLIEATAMPRRRRVARIVLCLATLALAIQLFSMAFHRHALNEHVSDCVSCYSASQIAGGSNESVLSLAVAAVVMYRQPLLVAVSRLSFADRFVIPPAHAPPVIS